MSSAPRPGQEMRDMRQRLPSGFWPILDCVAAALCAVVLYRSLGPALRIVSLPPWVGPVMAVALSLPVAACRRLPMPTLVILLGVSALITVSGIPAVPWPFLPIAYVLCLAAAGCRWQPVAVGLSATTVLLTAMTLVTVWRERSSGTSGSVGAVAGVMAGLIVLTAWAVGLAVRKQRLYIAGLHDLRARRFQDELEDSRRAVTEERLRIARELHDVVAHSMSVIAVQAGVGHHLIDNHPAAARAALAAVETTSRDVLVEMRDLLGVLRAPAAASLFPAPGLGDLDALISLTAKAGVTVDLHVTGQPRSLSAGLDLCGYRIVQEALTNMVKHAQTRQGRITIDYRPSEVFIEITDGSSRRDPVQPGRDGTGHGSAQPRSFVPGHGILGMRERVNMYRGQFSAGPVPGGFRVAASIPLPGAR